MDDTGNPIPLKEKFRQSLCLSCCFRANRRQTLPSEPPSPSSANNNSNNNRPHCSLVAALKSRAATEFPEMKDKCRNIFCRIGGGNGKHSHNRRHSSSDFRYDPLSYALNFEDESFDEAPLKGFTSRFPPLSSSATPPLPTVAENPHPLPVTTKVS